MIHHSTSKNIQNSLPTHLVWSDWCRGTHCFPSGRDKSWNINFGMVYGDLIKSATVYFKADNGGWLSINGNYIGYTHNTYNNSGTAFNVGSIFKLGTNNISVSVHDDDSPASDNQIGYQVDIYLRY